MKHLHLIGVLLSVPTLVLAQNIDSDCTPYVNFATQVAHKNYQLPYDDSEFVAPIKKSDYLPAPIVTWTLLCDVFGVNLDWLSKRTSKVDPSIFIEKEIQQRPDISDILKKYINKNWDTDVIHQIDEADDHIQLFVGAIPEQAEDREYLQSERCFMNLHQPNAIYCTYKTYKNQQIMLVKVYIVEEYS